MSRKTGFAAKMERLASAIADDALMLDRKMEDRIQAMRVLTPYFAMLHKIEQAPTAEEGSGFGSYKQAINLANARRAGSISAARRNGSAED